MEQYETDAHVHTPLAPPVKSHSVLSVQGAFVEVQIDGVVHRLPQWQHWQQVLNHMQQMQADLIMWKERHARLQQQHQNLSQLVLKLERRMEQLHD